MDVRTAENNRESWYITNNTSDTITIGDLLLLPAIKPGKSIDVLQFYTREKISHSVILTQLAKLEKVTITKRKIYDNGLPGVISVNKIDEAITPAEENELLNEVTEGEKITDDTEGILLHGKDPNDEAAPIGIAGEENNEILTMDLDLMTTLEGIYIELIKANIQMSIMTGNHIREAEIHISTQEN